jgi:prepilin-type N-terminal cleavage/methylation domain-containing protein
MSKLHAGFTLIELMVVVAIIGILMSAGILSFTQAQRASRDSRRRADVDAIAKAFEQYYQNNGEYFAGNYFSTTVSWASAPFLAAVGVFFPSGTLPLDPINDSSANYAYAIRSLQRNAAGHVNPASRFCVRARLERSNGNCTGDTGTSTADPDSYTCAFVTTGAGTHYCVENRQ